MSGPKSKPKTSAKKKAAVAPKRDNFNSLTWHKLRDSAGNVCSFPGCHVHTHGASSDGEGTVGIGVACHIKAAAPGGPRYDEHQTKDQRKHFDNGIWMCQTHSKLIDADDSAYSVETLVEWKQKAEARSNSLINQKSFTESEVKAAVEEGTVSVLQRWVIEYLDLARKVAEHCSEPILLKKIDFDAEVYTALRKYARLLSGPVASTRKPGWLCGGSFNYFEGCDISTFESTGVPPVIKLAQKDTMTFELFGQAITAPRVETIYTDVEFSLFTDLDDREKPKIELYTTGNSAITTQLQAEDSWIVYQDESVLEELSPLSN
ncbi:hypothetical protein PS910_04178 [Pseudomonas fluorescens]|nr:hypothetical protein PS910_04178 [Pseudomonas fluorescens]